MCDMRSGIIESRVKQVASEYGCPDSKLECVWQHCDIHMPMTKEEFESEIVDTIGEL